MCSSLLIFLQAWFRMTGHGCTNTLQHRYMHSSLEEGKGLAKAAERVTDSPHCILYSLELTDGCERLGKSEAICS